VTLLLKATLKTPVDDDDDDDVTGSHHYAAPEVAHILTSDDRADVWSVGCISLRMVLTGIRGVEDINSLLDNIKYAPSFLTKLIELAEEVTKGFSASLRKPADIKILQCESKN